MIYFGGALKAKQKITGRLGDILSNLYLATAVMAYYQSLTEHKKELQPVVKWALDDCFYNIQVAVVGFFENFTWLTRFITAPWFRLFTIGKPPSDALGQTVARLVQTNPTVREFLTEAIHVPSELKDGLSKYDKTYQQILAAQPAFKKVKAAIRSRQLPKKPIMQLLDQAMQSAIISAQEYQVIKDAEAARLDAIQVDAFTNEDYLSNSLNDNNEDKADVVSQSTV